MRRFGTISRSAFEHAQSQAPCRVPPAPCARVLVEPESALIDDARQISLLDFAPGEAVTWSRRCGRTTAARQSEAVFVADAEGSVDLTTSAPVSGSYGAVSRWARLVDAPDRRSAAAGHAFDQTAPLTIHLAAVRPAAARRAGSSSIFSAQVSTCGRSTRTASSARCSPAGAGTAWAGGRPERIRRRTDGSTRFAFAAHGYAALAPVTGAPGLPPTISQIPLEYFERACTGPPDARSRLRRRRRCLARR